MFSYNELYIESLKRNAKRFNDWNQLKEKSILITGGTGLICSYLVDMLMMMNEDIELNASIMVMGRSEDKCKERFAKWYGNDKFFFIEQDLNDYIEPEALKKKIEYQTNSTVNYIVHGASNAYPSAYDKDPVGTMRANIIGTDNLLRYGIQYNLERFIFLSSGEVYGERDVEYGVDEKFCGYTDYSIPRSCYPVSKMAAETLCASYMNQYELKTNVARLCHVYGPTMTSSDNRVINQFMRNALSGQDIVMKSTGSKVRSYCYVADAVIGLLQILLNGESGEAYNIAYDKSVKSIKEIAEITAGLAGKRVIISQDVEAGGTKIERSVLSGEKIKSIGFMGEYDIDTGLKECYDILHSNEKMKL